MSYRDEREGERAAWYGPNYGREHLDRAERARYAYTYSDPDRAYMRGYEGELERQREQEEREAQEARERARRAPHYEPEQWEDDDYGE